MLGVEIYWVGVWVWTAGFAIYLAGTFWWPSLNVARAGSILCLIGFLVTSYPFVEGFDFRAFVWPDDFSIGSLTPEVVDTLVAVTWVGGLVLVIASWLRIVSTKIGWVGFIVAMCAVVISWQDDPLSRGAVVAARAVLLAILFSLAAGMFFLVTDKGQSRRVVTSLTFRISLSVVLFVMLFIGYFTGLIKPHGLLPPQTEESLPEAGRNPG